MTNLIQDTNKTYTTTDIVEDLTGEVQSVIIRETSKGKLVVNFEIDIERELDNGDIEYDDARIAVFGANASKLRKLIDKGKICIGSPMTFLEARKSLKPYETSDGRQVETEQWTPRKFILKKHSTRNLEKINMADVDETIIADAI